MTWILEVLRGLAITESVKLGARKVVARLRGSATPSPKDLVRQAFDEALTELRPRLVKYSADGDIYINSGDLSRAISEVVSLSRGANSLWELRDPRVQDRVALLIASEELLVIGGHNLSEQDYLQIVKNYVSLASRKLAGYTVEHDMIFRQMTIEGVSKSHEIIEADTAKLELVLARMSADPGPREIRDHTPAPHGVAGSAYVGRVRNLLAEYLGTADEPVPFGGRGNLISALTAWAIDLTSRSYKALLAESGAGKTALLTQWVQALSEISELNFVYVPINIRFNTSQPSVFFSLLVSGLARIHGEPTTRILQMSPEELRGHANRLLSKEPPRQKPLVVVIDGLDEASGWEFGPDIIPLSPPPGLKVLVAARPLAGDSEEVGWPHRLAWAGKGLSSTLELHPLDESGVIEAIDSVSPSLGQLAEDEVFRNQVFRIAQGDPLVLRIVLDESVNSLKRGRDISSGIWRSYESGLEGVFSQWLEDQRKQWKDAGATGLEEEATREFLLACAFAKGPLGQEDLISLVEDEHPLEDPLNIDAAARAARRFVSGNGKEIGYSLSHPRLADFFKERLSSPARAEAWQNRFLCYGEETLAALEAGTLAPSEAKSYPVQHFGAHLLDSAERRDNLPKLLTKTWMYAWRVLDDSYIGYLAELERIWQYAEASSLNAVEFECGLIRASIGSLRSQYPFKLLKHAVECELVDAEYGWNLFLTAPTEVQVHSVPDVLEAMPERMQPDCWRYALRILGHAEEYVSGPAMPNIMTPLDDLLMRANSTVVESVLRDMHSCTSFEVRYHLYETIAAREDVAHDKLLASLATTADPYDRLRLLSRYAERVSEVDTASLENGLLGAWQEMPKDMRYDTLSEFFQFLGDPKRRTLLDDVKGMSDDVARARALLACIQSAPEDLRSELAALCLPGLKSMEPYSYLPPAGVAEMMRLLPVSGREEVEVAISPSERSYSKFDLLFPSLPYLSSSSRDELISIIRSRIADGGKFGSLIEAIAGQANNLTDAEFVEIVGAVDQSSNIRERLSALTTLKTAAPEHLKDSVQPDIGRYFNGERINLQHLEQLLPFIVEGLSIEALVDISDTAINMLCKHGRSSLLETILPHLSGASIENAFATVVKCNVDENKARGLSLLLDALPQESMAQFVSAALELKDASSRRRLLGTATPKLSDGLKRRVLESVESFGSSGDRVALATDLIRHSEGGLQLDALEIVKTFSADDHPNWDLVEVLDFLPREKRCEEVADMLRFARGLNDQLGRAEFYLRAAETGLGDPRELIERSIAALMDASWDDHLRIPGTLLASMGSCIEGLGTDDTGALVRKLIALHPQEIRTALLAAIFPKIPADCIPAIFESYEDEQDNEETLSLLIRLILDSGPHIENRQVSKVIRQIKGLPHPYTQSKLLAKLQSALDDPTKERLLVWANGLPDSEAKARIVLALLPFPHEIAPEGLHETLFRIAMEVENEHQRADILYRLLPFTSNQLSQQIYTALEELGDEFVKGEHVVWLHQHSDAVDDTAALGMIRPMESSYQKHSAITALIPSLDPSHQQEAIGILMTLGREDLQARGLLEAAHILSGAHSQLYLNALDAFEDARSRGLLAAGLASIVPPAERGRLRAIFSGLDNETLLDSIVGVAHSPSSPPLASWLLNETMPRLVGAIDGIHMRMPDEVLSSILLHMEPSRLSSTKPEFLEESLFRALSIRPDRFHSEDSRPEALLSLSSHIVALSRDQPASDLFSRANRRISRGTINEYLRDWAALLPWLAARSTTSQIEVVLERVRDIPRWWTIVPGA